MPIEQQTWLCKVLFQPNSKTGKQELTRQLRMWWYPPEPKAVHSYPPSSPGPFFLRPFFLLAPKRMWDLCLRCDEDCQAQQGKKQVCFHVMSDMKFNAMWLICSSDGGPKFLMTGHYLLVFVLSCISKSVFIFLLLVWGTFFLNSVPL